ncbi:hypothetical protein [Luteimonas sp. 100069]|uniref:hypothetical protein n=1 Tax=Luteimonas sp. 100069 TaxID=2006109 RepID=UPI000F4EC4E7|nr:hypothetical protein [Luteimonas sp. 100069]
MKSSIHTAPELGETGVSFKLPRMPGARCLADWREIAFDEQRTNAERAHALRMIERGERAEAQLLAQELTARRSREIELWQAKTAEKLHLVRSMSIELVDWMQRSERPQAYWRVFPEFNREVGLLKKRLKTLRKDAATNAVQAQFLADHRELIDAIDGR